MSNQIDVKPAMVRIVCREGETLYGCETCSHLYREERWALKCQEHCTKYNSYSLEITSNAVRKDKVKSPRALVLLSGGLDSMLAARLVADQGVEVEAVHFVTPLSKNNGRFVDKFCEETDVKLHKVFLGQEFLDMVINPKHGYGSQMNPCIDCRILELKKASELGEKIGADFLVTGEVLGERPFSQRKDAMLLIEKEAGLEGKILRPLSAKLLPSSEPEKRGLVERGDLFAIKGRRRHPQMDLAKKLGTREFPNPSGGCLLTDPRFAERLKEHLKHERSLSLTDVELLKVGRHFRIGKTKVIVGRNREENAKLLTIADKNNFTYMQVTGYMGPVALFVGGTSPEIVMRAAAITARYSDAPKATTVRVRCNGKETGVLETKPIDDEELRYFII